jgi:hypothetical protein
LRQVNEAVFKEFPDKRRASPMPKEYIQYTGKEGETDEGEVEYDIDDEVGLYFNIQTKSSFPGHRMAGSNQ